jgi:hypothetical protein
MNKEGMVAIGKVVFTSTRAHHRAGGTRKRNAGCHARLSLWVRNEARYP